MHQEEEGPTSLTKAPCFFSLHVSILFLFLYFSLSLFQCGWLCLGETSQHSMHQYQEKGGARGLPPCYHGFHHPQVVKRKSWGCLPFVFFLSSFSWLRTKGATTTTKNNEGEVQNKGREKGGNRNFELINHCQVF